MSVVVIVSLYTKDSLETVERLQLELIKAAKVYGQGKGTLEWRPVQDNEDRWAFAVLEKFDSEDVSWIKCGVFLFLPVKDRKRTC
jgi:hypothetical protein